MTVATNAEVMDAQLPRGPRFGALQLLRYARDPFGFYRSTAERYGEVYSVRTPLGPVVVCSEPEGLRALFSAPPETFIRFSTDAVEPLLGRHSVLLTSGAPHQKARRLLTPPFHGERMRAYGEVICAAATRAAEGWGEGEPFLMQDAGSAISIDVILRAVFGVDEASGLGAFREAILESMTALTPALMLVRPLRRRLGGFGPFARFLKLRERIDDLTYAELRRRRARAAPGEDILSLMLASRYDDGTAMSDEEVRDQLLTLVFAGHETSGIALAWAIHWLESTPRVKARLMAELDALGSEPGPEALAGCEYLEAFCNETLRLFPIVPEVIRLLQQPLQLLGYELPPGVGVVACIARVHNRPDLYADPAEFRPERFLDRKFSPFEFLPFGGGNRRCIGAAFAMYEMKLILGTLLKKRAFQLVHRDPIRPELRNLTMGPSGGVKVTTVRR